MAVQRETISKVEQHFPFLVIEIFLVYSLCSSKVKMQVALSTTCCSSPSLALSSKSIALLLVEIF